jgi:short-subunit dehydrogenase
MREQKRNKRSTEKVVIISGAASGIGLELGRLFARRGASVGLIDRDKTKLEEFADELLQAGTRCAVSIIDVRQREQVRGAVQEIVRALGPADILIPCAGICRASTVDDLEIVELEEVIRINFLGMIYIVEAVLPAMLRRRSGHIVGISSMAGLRGIPFEPAYSASKAAVAAYLESLRSELRQRGIAVTTVFPGYVQTPLLDKWHDGGRHVARESAFGFGCGCDDRLGHRPKTVLHLFALGARLQRSHEPADAAASVRSGYEPNV